MPTIALFSASHCGVEELARGVATALGLPLLEGTLLDEAASLAGAPPKRYLRSLLGAPSFLNNLTHDREKSLAYLQLALAKRLQHDDFVFQGLGLHLIPPQLTHVLRVCLLADLDYRLQHLVASGLEGVRAAIARKMPLHSVTVRENRIVVRAATVVRATTLLRTTARMMARTPACPTS